MTVAKNQESTDQLVKQIGNDLMQLADCYVQQKHQYHQHLTKVEEGPSFLQRMEYDQQIRKQIDKVNREDQIDPKLMLNELYSVQVPAAIGTDPLKS